MTGRQLLHYQIVQKIGEGGMGAVYQARDTHLDRFVAVKVLLPEVMSNPDRKRRFVQEAKAASALNHPNIIHIYDIAFDSGVDFIAMEYVDGKTLDSMIGRKGLRLAEALKYAIQIADGLAKAHAAGIIHRDLKPANLMVNLDGVVKVLDFGLAKLTEAGGMYQLSHYNGFALGTPGQAGFRFTGTGVPGDTNFTSAGGNSFASFLLGHVDNANIVTDRFIGQQWRHFAGYFQDDYRVTKSLTLNLGLRWETTLPPVERRDQFSDFSPTRLNPAAGGLPGALVFAGTGPGREGSRTLADSYFRAFGPHVGLSFSLGHSTVIRAAYSRSFGAVTTVSGTTHQRGFVQGLLFQTQTQGVEPAFRFRNGMPFWPAPPFINPSAANGDAMPWWQGKEATRPPENNSWTFSIQRQATPSLLVEAAYNGLAGSHLQAGLLNYNQVDPRFLGMYGGNVLTSSIDSALAAAAGIRRPFAAFNGSVAQALRPFPQYQVIDTRTGGGDRSGHSSYHALVLRAEKRYSAGLIFQSSYVLSKILTDADSYWSTEFPPAMDHYNRRLEKSIGFFDQTHNFKLGLVYDLPFGKARKFWLAGWRLGSTMYYASGAPVNLDTTISLPLFPGRFTPTVTSYEGWRGPTTGEKFDPQTDRFFQAPSFFGPQPNNRFGNATRLNPKLRVFPSYDENLSVAKSFPVTDTLRVDFRWEAFNLLNRVRFDTGPRRLQDPNFGRLSSNADVLNEPRRMQVALKLYW